MARHHIIACVVNYWLSNGYKWWRYDKKKTKNKTVSTVLVHCEGNPSVDSPHNWAAMRCASFSAINPNTLLNSIGGIDDLSRNDAHWRHWNGCQYLKRSYKMQFFRQYHSISWIHHNLLSSTYLSYYVVQHRCYVNDYKTYFEAQMALQCWPDDIIRAIYV